MEIQSKLPAVGTTIFTVMSKLAADSGAINLSQGFPNFPVDPILLALLEETSQENVHQYMPMPGSPFLLEKIGQLVHKSYGRSIVAHNEALVTAGATQAIFTAIQALVHPHDEVVILDPSYDCYDPAIVLAGGTAKHVSLSSEFLPDWEKISSSVNAKTRMIIINNPHNPSGRVWSSEDFSELEKLADTWKNLIILSDEVYEFITFEQKHISVHQYPSLRDRSIIVSSFGKTFHITGWKMGYLIAPQLLMNEIKKVHQFNVFSVNSIAQATLTKYLDHVDVSTLGSFYASKRDFFRENMKQSRFELLPCEGTYFQLARYSQISDLSDVDFCKWLTTECGVAAIPISVFNEDASDQQVIRFCFAKDEETLLNATKKLCAI